MRLLDLADEYLIRDKIFTYKRNREGYWPTEARTIAYVDDEPKVIGTCHRKTYYALNNIPYSNPFNAKTMRIFSIGNKIEEEEINIYRSMGGLISDQHRIYIDKYKITGKVDAIVNMGWMAKYMGKKKKPKHNIVGVELKSSYGYPFQKQIFGNKSQEGSPQDEALLQTSIYAHELKLPFIIIYISRDNLARSEFKVLIEEVKISSLKLSSKNINRIKKMYGEIVHIPEVYLEYPNGSITTVKVPTVIMEDVYENYSIIAKKFHNNELPERDFSLKYTPERVEIEKDAGNVAKTTYEKWNRNPEKYPIGDWQCSYCSYKDFCYSNEGEKV